MKTRYPRKAAIAVAKQMVQELTPVTERLVVAGSLRRMKTEVGDVEIVYIPRKENRPVPGSLFDRADYDLATLCILDMEARGILTRRESVTGHTSFGEKNKLMLHAASGIPVDFFATSAECWWNYLVCRTGSAENNTTIATAARLNGKRWNPYGPGFVCLKTGDIFPAHSEEDVYRLAGLDFLPPSHR